MNRSRWHHMIRVMRLISLMFVLPHGCADRSLDAWQRNNQARANQGPANDVIGADIPSYAAGSGADTVSPSASTSPRVARDTSAEPVELMTINAETLTVDDVLLPIREDLETQARSMSPRAYMNYAVEKITDQVRMLARESLLYQHTSDRLSEQEEKLIDNFTDQQIRHIVQQDHQGRHTRWLDEQARLGRTPEEGRERIRRQVVVRSFLERSIKPRIGEPTRHELLKYYEEHRGEMTTKERRELFLIEIPKQPDAARADAIARQALQEIHNGAPFEDVARRHSQGIHAADGGAWGFVDPQSLRGKWATAAEASKSLPPGGTSNIVDTGDAYFIAHTGRVEPAQTPDFAEVQLVLKEAYRERQFVTLVDDLVRELHENAVIEPADINRFLRGVLNHAPTPPNMAPVPNR